MTFENDMAKAQEKLRNGQYKHAFRAAKSAMKKNARVPFAANLAGIALGGMGNHREAVNSFTKALKLDPNYHDARKNLAQSLILLGKSPAALALLSKLVVLTPDDPDAWYLLAQVNLKLNQPAEVVRAASVSISKAPNIARGYHLRAMAFKNLGQTQKALADFTTQSELAPTDPAPLLEKSVLLIRLFRLQEARAALEAALGLTPDNPQAHNLMGMLMMMQGNQPESIAHYRRTIDVDPNHAEAFLQLASLQDQAENAGMVPQLETAMKSAPKAGHAAGLLHFARAIIHHQSGDATAEAKELVQANRIEAALRPYDYARADKVLEGSTQELPTGTDAHSNSPVPVFIFGLPRSGTTMLEQILTASDQVFGCGELPMGSVLTDLVADGSADGFNAVDFAGYYRENLPEMPAGTTHFVDKLPGNYKVIGLLHAAFPNARFLHLGRDPRDVALSMWRAYFAEGGLDFTFDQEAMAYEVNQYRRYMQCWGETRTIPMLSLQYEDVVRDIETAGRQAAGFCGFDWTETMARPDLNTGAVRTASALQVRDGVHTKSVRAWQSSASALATFIAELDPQLWPELSE